MARVAATGDFGPALVTLTVMKRLLLLAVIVAVVILLARKIKDT